MTCVEKCKRLFFSFTRLSQKGKSNNVFSVFLNVFLRTWLETWMPLLDLIGWSVRLDNGSGLVLLLLKV